MLFRLSKDFYESYLKQLLESREDLKVDYQRVMDLFQERDHWQYSKKNSVKIDSTFSKKFFKMYVGLSGLSGFTDKWKEVKTASNAIKRYLKQVNGSAGAKLPKSLEKATSVIHGLFTNPKITKDGIVHSIVNLGEGRTSLRFWKYSNAIFYPRVVKKDYESPAYILLIFRAIDGTSGLVTNKLTIFDTDNISLYTLLDTYGLAISDESNIELMKSQISGYFKFRDDFYGEQFLAIGTASAISTQLKWYERRSSTSLTARYEGRPARVIADFLFDQTDGTERKIEKFDDLYNTSKWNKKVLEQEQEDGSIEKIVVAETELLPVHPKVKVFCLDRFDDLEINLENLSLYEYNKNIKSGLVLPDEHFELLDVLVAESNRGIKGNFEISEDLVSSKSGGLICLLTGVPGVGKTLTASVYSEMIERPLYVTTAAQLGVTPDSIEKNLRKVLRRASKWRAVLLLDECDVYLRHRGDDIDQNAIVGVFLRVLESYPGILFLTSNRLDAIDSAIESRCTISLKYEKPTISQALKIANIQANLMELDVDEKSVLKWLLEYTDVDKSQDMSILMETESYITGRNIRNALKLIKIFKRNESEENQKVIYKDLEKVSKYKRLG
jgi:DNA polymerase III delta prime subunit